MRRQSPEGAELDRKIRELFDAGKGDSQEADDLRERLHDAMYSRALTAPPLPTELTDADG